MNPLSIGEAAKRLGVSVDTVREMEKAGELKATRTPGGHRRFKPEILEAYLKGSRRPKRESPSTPRSVADEPDEPDWPEEATWTPALLPARLPAPTPIAVDSSLERLKQAAAERAERDRLERLRSYARTLIPWNAQPSARSAVLESTATYVTEARFPASLPSWEAQQAIKAKVEAILEPYQAEAARKTAKEAEARTRELRIHALIERGKSRAWSQTLGWDHTSGQEARAEVEHELKREVEADWSEGDVDDLVDEILDEWEDET